MDPSESSDINSLALQTRDLHKFYGTGRKAFHVLRGLNLDVPYGTIYGLLGASGCGKTTLLRCALGRLPIHSGNILILGKPPGAKGHTVPGKDVGYMPQETALIFEFTMLELMRYFGILYRMNMQYTKKRTEFLKEFLSLPTIHRRCGLMSGGQKRRISFALALLHEPPLLILDEPTVGIDPLLRSKIWQHLLEITSAGNTTIVLTTHYIEEARQSHVVGLMRSGKLLAQSRPDDLIRAFNVNTLEDVFLKLSEEEELAGQRRASKGGAAIKYPSSKATEKTPLIHAELPDDDDEEVIKPPPLLSPPKFGYPRLPKFFNLLALLWKQMMKFFREPLMLFLVVISPMIQYSVFCLAYGRDPEDLKVYVANLDSPSDKFPFVLGNRFIHYIDEDTIDLEFTSDPSDGLSKVEGGTAYGFVLIPQNYSTHYFNWQKEICTKVLDPQHPFDDSILDNATIHLFMDITNQQIFYAVNQTLNAAFRALLADIRNFTGVPDYLDRPIIMVNDYVYGGDDVTFDDTVNTAMFGSVLIALSTILTATQLITERKEGVIDRTWVAGVSVTEIVLSQALSFFVMLCAQLTPLFFLIIYAFDLPREGNLLWAYLLIIGQGMVGVVFGLMISAYLSSEATALEISVGIFYPIILSAGLMWPLVALPKWLQTIIKCFPMAIPSEGARSVFIRGWGLDREPVWLGFIIVTLWILLLLFLTGLGLHLKK